MRNINNENAVEFAESVFSMQFPPNNPFFIETWLGVAFDRNRYEQLAPSKWWVALMSCSREMANEKQLFFLEKRPSKSSEQTIAVAIRNAEESICEYLDEGESFLKNQYLVGESGRWACFLDQDVSLFGGDQQFMSACFAEYGGRPRLLVQMREDFLGEDVPIVGSSDPFVLDFESYFNRLLGL